MSRRRKCIFLNGLLPIEIVLWSKDMYPEQAKGSDYALNHSHSLDFFCPKMMLTSIYAGGKSYKREKG